MENFGISKINPININPNGINFIDCIFNSFGIEVPYIKLSFFSNGENVLERMFICEDNDNMITAVMNVISSTDEKTKKIIYRRAVYMIVRSKISYVHFASGEIFSDLFEYSILESYETDNCLVFVHNGIQDTLFNIKNRDSNYKTNTSVFFRYYENDIENFHEIGNDIFNYIKCSKYYGNNEIDKKIGYYLKNENFDYFHPILRMKKSFGYSSFINQMCDFYLQNFDRIGEFTGKVFDKNQFYPSNCDEKANYFDNSLHGIVASLYEDSFEKNLQNIKFNIGFFISEILYRYIYGDFEFS